MKCVNYSCYYYYALSIICGSIGAIDAFIVTPKVSTRSYPLVLFSSATDSVAVVRSRVIDLAERLKDQYGTFIVEKEAKQELEDAVSELESVSELPENYLDYFLGDWTLVCTTAVSTKGVDTSKLPDFLKQIRDTVKDNVNKRLKVVQRIRCTAAEADGGAASTVDRVDNVLEYEPPAALKDLPSLFPIPEQISNININPLQVSKSKVILVHKASITSTKPLKTKVAWTSVVLNVAGTSTVLEPNGKDVASLNLPLGEFVNTGDFETTYLDKDLRISRGKVGISDQLRIFVRSDKFTTDEIVRDMGKTPVTDGKGVDSLIDVDDERVDPTFEAVDDSSPEAVDDIGEEESSEENKDNPQETT